MDIKKTEELGNTICNNGYYCSWILDATVYYKKYIVYEATCNKCSKRVLWRENYFKEKCNH